MALKDRIAQLITSNVELQDEQLEVLLETVITRTAELTAAASEFEKLAGEDEKTLTAGEGLVSLAAEFGEVFPNLTLDQKERFKGVVDNIYVGVTPEIDAAAQGLFNKAVDTVFDVQELVNYYASTHGEVPEGGE